MTNIKPLADRVLVRPAEAEQKTASGIIIPDTAKEKPQRGEVLDRDRDRRREADDHERKRHLRDYLMRECVNV